MRLVNNQLIALKIQINQGDLDIIKVYAKFRKSLTHDVKAILSLSLDSDHHVVVALVNLCYTLVRPLGKRSRLAVEKLKEHEMKEKLAENLHKKLETDEEENFERTRELSKKAILESIEDTNGFKYIGGKKKRTHFWNTEVQNAVKDKNDALRKWLKEKTEDSKRNYVTHECKQMNKKKSCGDMGKNSREPED
ncbi:hypothetical protein E2C01_010859 [Portunus trituberculatus]|uniref:Uncharacterized protein n=1 Tax=Portunus trituberculatus TaxID=210409 RepID=A0A5B7D9I4_PORTR|nr:hypothetical protein [Portunus trituberculatus]